MHKSKFFVGDKPNTLYMFMNLDEFAIQWYQFYYIWVTIYVNECYPRLKTVNTNSLFRKTKHTWLVIRIKNAILQDIKTLNITIKNYSLYKNTMSYSILYNNQQLSNKKCLFLLDKSTWAIIENTMISFFCIEMH